MAILAKSSGGGNYEQVAAGSYAARCVSMIEIGTVTENVLGQDKTMHKVRISWELPTETKVFKEENGEQPYMLSKEFTLSMHEKATLRKFLESWRGKTFSEEEAKVFDITNLIGKPCLISVNQKTTKTGNVFAEIAGVNLLPKGMECPPQINPSTILSYDNWDAVLFESLPQFIKDKIISSAEYKAMETPQEVNVGESKDDGFPF